MPLNTRSTTVSVGHSTPHYGGLSSYPSTATAAAAAAAGKSGMNNPQSPGFYRQDSFTEEAPRFIAEWQDTEDLQCSLVEIISDDQELLKQASSQKIISKSTSTPPVGLLTPLSGPIEIARGVNVLRFMAAPLRRGLYRPVRVTGSFYNLQISFEVESTVTDLDPIGSTNHPFFPQPSDSYVPEDAVVLEVEPLLPRVIVEPATALGGGRLVSGQGQWLGLHIKAGRDHFEDTTLDITWPNPLVAGDLGRKVSGVVDVQGGSSPLPTSVSISSAGSDIGGPGGLVEPVSPVLTPQHEAALISRSSTSGAWEKTDLVRYAAARGGGGAVSAQDALWAEEGHQEFALPSLTIAEDEDRNSAATVWWWVESGTFAVPPEQVKVSAPGTIPPPPPPQFQTLFSGGGGGVGNTAVHGHRGIDSEFLSLYAPQSIVDLPVALQYLCGCRRSFTKVLPITVQNPFAVRTTATELSNSRIVVHFHITSLLPYVATLSGIGMHPQPGLVLERDLAGELGLLPATVPVQGSFSLSFILGLDESVASGGDRAAAQIRLQQAAKVQPSALQLNYQIDIKDVCGVEIPAPRAVHAAGHAGHRTTVHAGQGNTSAVLPIENGGENSTTMPVVRLPSIASLQRLQGSQRGGAGAALSNSRPNSARSTGQQCFFTHRCALELASLEKSAPGAIILVQLLGPFSAVAGHPVSLCWRLERVGAAADSIATPVGKKKSAAAASAAIARAALDLYQAGDAADEGMRAAYQNAIGKPSDDGPKKNKSAQQPHRIQFECVPQEENWKPVGRRGGSVTIESYDGALATVEAMWMPIVPGTLPVPSLRLIDCAYQECFDVGSGGTNYLVVAPPPQ